MNENIERIVRYSKLLKYLILFVALLDIALNFLFWIFINKIPFFVIQSSMPVQNVERMVYPIKVQIIGIIESLIPLGIVLTCFYFLYGLFSSYEKMIYSMRENAYYYKMISIFYLIYSVVRIIHRSILGAILTLPYGEGKRVFAFGMSSNDVHQILVALSILMVAWVMRETSHKVGNAV